LFLVQNICLVSVNEKGGVSYGALLSKYTAQCVRLVCVGSIKWLGNYKEKLGTATQKHGGKTKRKRLKSTTMSAATRLFSAQKDKPKSEHLDSTQVVAIINEEFKSSQFELFDLAPCMLTEATSDAAACTEDNVAS
jgi:hypothetical protein